MTKPTFLCIGVQKAGTTSLTNYLLQHPEIFMKGNEIHFFDKPKQYNLTQKDFEQYEAQFNTHKSIVGEKTPSYNYLHFAMDRIYNYNPNIKLILILREPISRAYSQYNMNAVKSKQSLCTVTDEQIMKDFEEDENIGLSELTQNGNYYVVRGKYDEIISYIFSKFPKQNVYIGIAEEIRADKFKYYNEIFKFLGAKELQNINTNRDAHINKYTKPIPSSLEKKLYEIYKPHNERLYEILGRKIDLWETYYENI